MAGLPYEAGDLVKVDVLILIDGSDVPVRVGEFHVGIARTASAEEAVASGAVPEGAFTPEGAVAVDPNEVVTGLISVARGLRRMAAS